MDLLTSTLRVDSPVIFSGPVAKGLLRTRCQPDRRGRYHDDGESGRRLLGGLNVRCCGSHDDIDFQFYQIRRQAGEALVLPSANR